MSHQVIDEEVALLEQALVDNLARIEALTAYALKQVDRAPSLPGLSSDEMKFLDSEDGRSELARLLIAFRESVTLLKAYRNEIVHSRIHPPVDDLTEAMEASERPLGALRRRLARLVPSD